MAILLTFLAKRSRSQQVNGLFHRLSFPLMSVIVVNIYNVRARTYLINICFINRWNIGLHRKRGKKIIHFLRFFSFDFACPISWLVDISCSKSLTTKSKRKSPQRLTFRCRFVCPNDVSGFLYLCPSDYTKEYTAGETSDFVYELKYLTLKSAAKGRRGKMALLRQRCTEKLAEREDA